MTSDMGVRPDSQGCEREAALSASWWLGLVTSLWLGLTPLQISPEQNGSKTDSKFNKAKSAPAAVTCSSLLPVLQEIINQSPCTSRKCWHVLLDTWVFQSHVHILVPMQRYCTVIQWKHVFKVMQTWGRVMKLQLDVTWCNILIFNLFFFSSDAKISKSEAVFSHCVQQFVCCDRNKQMLSLKTAGSGKAKGSTGVGDKEKWLVRLQICTQQWKPAACWGFVFESSTCWWEHNVMRRKRREMRIALYRQHLVCQRVDRGKLKFLL